ncbi:hypothetical protein FIBSPDRAFT_498883 [Athelia psychrophila]|uniref:Uncharacterized protein n=1 Tax=Athelia psychrophila TaxID=1759441 RepID=A0A166K8S6_9AGAM|nr:hypothetical protein FIBSPDRAFT_498883 [Fibularhizoctonia sp. CBS 109695]
MGRWTQYEEDAHRLPEGVIRTGYDADTQTYFFSDKTTGLHYQSGPRQSYGTLELVDDSSTLHMFAPPDEDDSSQSEDLEDADSLQSEDPEDSSKSPSKENRKVKLTHGQSMDAGTLENPPKTERSSRRARSVSHGQRLVTVHTQRF